MLIRSINCISSLQEMLTILRIQGPLTEGVFRKAANEKSRKELKEDLNYGRDLDLKSKSVHLLAVVFKVMYENYLFSNCMLNFRFCAKPPYASDISMPPTD